MFAFIRAAPDPTRCAEAVWQGAFELREAYTFDGVFGCCTRRRGYSRLIFAIAVRILHDNGEAEEVLQEVLFY
jgi:hypothetical protein